MATTSRIETLSNSIRNMTTESKTGIVLAMTFFFSLFLGLYFVIGPAVKGDYAVSGGSDAYYNMRIVQYILSTHHQLLFDAGLNYPMGLENPRPPFFHWLIVLLGYAFSPFLGGVYASTMTMFLASTAIGGAFIVFPTYFLGKEIFGRKVGILAAILVAMSPLTLMKSIGTIGLFDIFTALFGLMFIYYFLRAINTFKFESDDSSVLKSIFLSIRSNNISIVYSLLAGVSLAASMLTWVGSISLILILLGAAVVQLAIFTIKRKSALSIFVSNLFFGIAFIIAFPWYYVAHFIPVRFEYPFLMWVALFISSLYFLILRKRPWLFSLGAFIIAAAAAIAILFEVDRSLIFSILSGQHYFIKNKIYDTIAEAQSLPLGEDMLEFGAFTFFASFLGLAYLVYKWVKTATFNMTMAVLYFGGIIVISMIASKFLYFGATAASILTAYIVVKSFELLSFRETIEKSRSRPIRTALRRELKFAHYAVILIVVFLLIVPTTFYAVDSAIPYNNKTAYDRQLYNDTPSFLKPANYTSPFYLGAFGASLATPNQPWGKALSWFQNQDAQLPPEQRPAFVSWWDYGFQTLEQGNHPVMADNFQDGVYPAAQILMAQNESEVISVMTARMLLNYSLDGNFNDSAIIPVLNQYIGQQGAQTIMKYVANPDSYIPKIYANPSYYGQYVSIQPGDAYYILVEHYLTNTYPLGTLINLYSAVEQQMNKYMSYISVDYGLFPFSATNTGIFYAPSYLGDFPYVNASGQIIPIDFYNITVTDSLGNVYPLQNFPSGATPVNYTINYTPAFYNTTIYRTFIGFPPSVIGASGGIPGISSKLTSYSAMQDWGLPNFEVVYKTVLWNPYTDYQNHSSAWQTVSLEQGYYYQQHHDGTVDLYPPASVLSNDVIFSEYYPGAIIHGRVTNSNNTPIQGVRVTIVDQYGIPHETVLTNSSGYYSLYAVAGNDTVEFSTGAYNALFMVGNKTLSYYNVTISNAQANRMSYNVYGQPTWNITHNLVLPTDQVNGIVYLNLLNRGSYSSTADMPVSGTVKYYNSTYNATYITSTMQNGSYQIGNLMPYSYDISAYVYGEWYNNISSITIGSSIESKDIPLQFGVMNASMQSGTSLPYPGNITFSRGNFHITYNLTSAGQGFYVPVGTFNISAYSGGYWDNFTAIASNNSTTQLNLQFSKYYTVTIKTEINGKPVSAPVEVNNGSGLTQTVFTNQNGTGSLSTPVSVNLIYSKVYYGGRYYSASQILNVSGSMTDVINLQPSYLVTGQYKVNNKPQNNTNIAIVGNGTLVDLYGNASGYFSIYLPPGQYNAVTESHYNFSLYVASMQFTVSNENVVLELSGSPGYQLNGSVSYNGRVVSGLVTSEVNGKQYFDSFSKVGGHFIIYLQKGVNTSSLGFITPGYSVQSVSSSNINLKILPVTVSITAPYAGSLPLTLYMNGTINYVAVGSHSFNVSVMPGNYSIAFGSPGVTISAALLRVDAVPQQAVQHFFSPLKISATLAIDPSNNVYIFQDGKLVSTSSNSTLQIGKYLIYSYSGSTAWLTNVNLTENSFITPVYQAAYEVTFITSLPSNVTISSVYGRMNWTGSILLPEGSYNFTIEKKFNSTSAYYASSSTFVSAPATITLNATLKELFSSVTLQLFSNDSKLSNGKFYIQGPRNVSGTLNSNVITLPYGPYSIYATSGSLAYFGGFNVSSQSIILNLTMRQSYPLNYGTYLNNTPYIGMISIKDNPEYLIPPSGIIYLPNGSYYFAASTTYDYYGFTDNYSVDQKVIVSGISSATLAFKIDQVVNVSFNLEAGNPVLKENQSITFPLLITSNSNVPLTFTVQNASSFSVTGGSLRLAPYSSGITNVTIKVPIKQGAGPATVDVRIYYGGTYRDLNVNVTVPAIQDVTAVIRNDSGKITGSTLELPMTIFNKGNVKTEVKAVIINQAQLAANGINVTINHGNSYFANISSNSNSSTYIIVNSTNGASISGRIIYVLLTYGNTTKIVSVSMHTPQLTVQGAKGSGYLLTGYSPTVQDYYIYGFSAFIVLAMVAVMLIFRRRFRT
jgi:dolichyl-diphosphooligosaccharide--protein glycosyltransferase